MNGPTVNRNEAETKASLEDFSKRLKKATEKVLAAEPGNKDEAREKDDILKLLEAHAQIILRWCSPEGENIRQNEPQSYQAWAEELDAFLSDIEAFT